MSTPDAGIITRWIDQRQKRLYRDDVQITAFRLVIEHPGEDDHETISEWPIEFGEKVDHIGEEVRAAIEEDVPARVGQVVYHLIAFHNVHVMGRKTITLQGQGRVRKFTAEHDPNSLVAALRLQLDANQKKDQTIERLTDTVLRTVDYVRQENLRLGGRIEHLEGELDAASEMMKINLDEQHKQKLEEMKVKSELKNEETLYAQFLPFLGPMAARMLGSIFGGDEEMFAAPAEAVAFKNFLSGLEPKQMIALQKAVLDKEVALTETQQLFLMQMFEKLADERLAAQDKEN